MAKRRGSKSYRSKKRVNRRKRASSRRVRRGINRKSYHHKRTERKKMKGGYGSTSHRSHTMGGQMGGRTIPSDVTIPMGVGTGKVKDVVPEPAIIAR